MVRMDRPKADRRRGFTLIEVLVVVAIIALLISILLPSLTRARGQSQFVVCQTHLKELGKAISMYALEYRDVLPGPQHPGMLTRTPEWITSREELRKFYLPNMLRKYFSERGTNSTKSVSDQIATCPSNPIPDTVFAKAGIGSVHYTINTNDDTTPQYYFGFITAKYTTYEDWFSDIGKNAKYQPKNMQVAKQPARRWMIGDAWSQPCYDAQVMGDYPGLPKGTWRRAESGDGATGPLLARAPFHMDAGYVRGSPSSSYKGKTSVLFFDSHVEGVNSSYWNKYDVMIATERN